MPTAQSRTRGKAYNHDFCCSEQGRRLRLCWGRSDFPHGDLKKPPQGTLGSFASFCFSGLSQTSLQLESPVVFLQTSGKPAPPGQQSHHTASPEWLLPSSQAACPGVGHSLRGWRITDRQENNSNCTGNSAVLTRDLLSAGVKGVPSNHPTTLHQHHPLHTRGDSQPHRLPGNTSSATLEVSARGKAVGNLRDTLLTSSLPWKSQQTG